MTEYKENDKVVVQVFNTDSDEPKYDVSEYGRWIYSNDILGKLEDFQPAQEKIKMTVEEKKEFDELKKILSSLYGTLDEIVRGGRYNNLYNRVFHNGNIGGSDKAQLEFARAWDKPSRIEIIKPEHEFKAGDLVKGTGTNENAVIININDNGTFPIKILYETGIIDYLSKEDLEFVKSNAINWEDGE